MDKTKKQQTVSGANGTVVVSGMSANKLTVTHIPGMRYTSMKLYLSAGNSTELVLANHPMSYSGGRYTYTATHSSFTSGATIYVGLHRNNNGVESMVPQGTLGNTTTWASFNYSTSTVTNTSTMTGSGNSTVTIPRRNGNKSTVNSPGRIEAETYAGMSGVMTEPCSEGGRNVGYIDKGDWMNYPITITTAGEYRISYRVSSIHSDRYLSADYNAGSVHLGNVTVPNTGSWQTYTTVSHVVNLPAGSINFGLNGGNGGWNINWFEIVWAGNSPSVTLIPLNSGMHMTIQFANNTAGAYSNSRIYVCVVARNASAKFSYLKPDGALIPITANQQSTDWTYKLSDINGFQVPSTMTSARLFISMDKAVVMRGIVDGAGNIGVVQPDLNNPSDPNVNTYFDWIEFTVSNGGYWGNTTQVDQFCFPITKELFNKSGSGYVSHRKVGITKTREEIFRAFEALPQAEFRSLVKRPYRIIAPCKGDFRVGRPYGNYMKSYVDQVWNYFKSNTMSFSHPLGNFTGRVLGDDRFEFTRTSDNTRYYIARRPNNDELFEGSGVLASGNTVELALQAQACAALNRHVFQTPTNWAKPWEYYKAAPANFYAKFWHDNSLGGFAYGFCYDDVADQSTLIETHSARGMVIGIGW